MTAIVHHESMSDSYFRYWGKADPRYVGEPKWHPLACHSLDVAAVGVHYLRRSPSIRQLMTNAFEIETDAALENWFAFWLAIHDLGKFSEAFQSQRPDLFEMLRDRPPYPSKAYRLRHDSLGMLFWSSQLSNLAVTDSWFYAGTEMLVDGLDCWARAVTGHHGQPPKQDNEFWEQHFDRKEDRAAIVAFVSDVRSLFLKPEAARIPASLGAEKFHRTSVDLSWWVSGITVLSDWLGSNVDFFPYSDGLNGSVALAGYWEQTQERARRALDASGVLPVPSGRELDFRELFPAIAIPSPLQKWAASVELTHGPQIHLLEDVTGAGKTEAAVTLAHRLIATQCADGLFIGLPTMATANAMYGRIARTYSKLFSGQASLALAHGQRNLVEAFADSILPAGREEHDEAQLDETATTRCTAWLADHNKRALLAPAGVGTIDQALLAVLHSKHQSLRLLGLFRKVLVVDEVHACDAYMLGVLRTLLEFHARSGGSAILLSATLPMGMKEVLVKAFAKGSRAVSPGVRAMGYPLVTSWNSSLPDALLERAISTRPDVRRTLKTRYVSDEAAVVSVIQDALAEAKCVCWMRNTIADALAAYEVFKSRIPIEKLTLFHARFALRDRLEIEQQVQSWFGSASIPDDRAGRLLIATQVVEQSLDVDFDFVVTDLAPVDRVIQRAGRLQRHPRDMRGHRLGDPTARDQRGEPCLWVHGPEWSDDPPANWFKKAFPKAPGVYPHHGQLWCTAKLLRGGRIAMPEDARRLIEHVFGDSCEFPAGLQANANAAEGQGFADASVAQQNTVKLATGYERGGLDWWSEARTPSRLGEAATSVLLARWDGDVLTPWTEHANDRHAWAYSAVRIAERLIARPSEATTTQRKAAVERAMESLPAKGKWSVLLPFEETSQGWIGAAWTAATKSKAERLLKWIYDPVTGLQPYDDDSISQPEDQE